MNKYTKLFGILTALYLIFLVISCANDSVEETPPEPAPEKPLIEDGEYTINLHPYLEKREFNEFDTTTNKRTTGTLKGNALPPKCTISGCKNGNGEYFWYSYDLTKEANKPSSNINGKGIILAKKVIFDNKLTVTVSNGGKNVSYDWTKIDYIGGYINLFGTELLQFSNEDRSETLLFAPKINENKYVGTWKYLKEAKVKYTITINEGNTGVFIMDDGSSKNITLEKGELAGMVMKEGTANLGILLLKEDKGVTTLIFTPDKSLNFPDMVYEFTK